jgi:hypothetical protein
LKIVGRPVGDRRTNDAQLLFEAVEFTGIRAPQPYKVEVPDGWGTWAIVCRPSEGFFYLLSKGVVRKIDYTNPHNVTDTPANDLPAEFRDEVKRILDIHEISAESQADILGKPVAPAALPVDLNAANAPRTATSPGRFELGDDVQLVIRQTTDDERIKFEKQGLPGSFLGTIVFPGPEPEAARGASPYEIILEEVFAFVWEPASKKLWVTDISEGQRIIIWMYLGGEDQTRPGAQKVMLREFDFSDPFDVKVTHITTSENGGAWSWGKLLPQNFQAPVMQALGERGKRLLDFCETQGSEKPIAKGIPKLPKLADDRYVKSGVPLAELNWPMSWGEEKSGLSTGLRIIGDARVGGEVRVELWVRNSDEKDLKFSKCHRADVGLHVVANDKEGKEHYADITQFRGYPVFSHLLLPPGHIVKVKEFSVKIGSKKNDELESGWVSLDLTPGDYMLRAKWTDTTSGAAHEGEWTGDLTAGEVDLKIIEPDVVAMSQPDVIPVRAPGDWSADWLAFSEVVAESRGLEN